MLRKSSFFSIVIFSLILGQDQEVDSLSQKSPKIAALRSFMFPGGGQFYNDQPIGAPCSPGKKQKVTPFYF